MKGVDTIARVRREFFVRGRSIKEIARELHISRNTVRKIVRSAMNGAYSRSRGLAGGGTIWTGCWRQTWRARAAIG